MFPGGDQIYVNPIRNGHHHLPEWIKLDSCFIIQTRHKITRDQAWKLREQKPGAVIDKRSADFRGKAYFLLLLTDSIQPAVCRPHQNTKCQETPRHAKQIPDARIGTRNEQLIGREREMCQKMQD